MTLMMMAVAGLLMTSPGPGNTGPLDRPEFDEVMGVALRGAPIRQVFDSFSEASGVTFELDPEVTGTVTLTEPRSNVRRLLELVGEQRGLVYRAEGGSIRVGLRASPSSCTARASQGGSTASMVEFTWSPVQGAESYRLVVAREKGLARPVIDRSGISLTSQGTRGLPPALYYWKVETSAGDGACGVQELDLRGAAPGPTEN